MDDTKSLLLSILFIATLFAANAFAAEIEYIGPDKHRQLEELFAKSIYTAGKDDVLLRASEWRCDMFGVRTRMQVQHELELYRWRPNENTKGLHNEGAQIVSEYKATSGALVGIHEQFEDLVKLSHDGQLVSRLSIVSPKRVVIAYSVCNRL